MEVQGVPLPMYKSSNLFQTIITPRLKVQRRVTCYSINLMQHLGNIIDYYVESQRQK